ncbi:MAG TPA: hypothetical protein VM488_18120 [Pseudobacter sp.]|nr:hypothetical protein [Pseudobacter sp.]
MPLEQFMGTFRQFNFDTTAQNITFEKDGPIVNHERVKNTIELYTYIKEDEVKAYLDSHGIPYTNLRPVQMSLEDAFIGLTGKY